MDDNNNTEMQVEPEEEEVKTGKRNFKAYRASMKEENGEQYQTYLVKQREYAAKSDEKKRQKIAALPDDERKTKRR